MGRPARSPPSGGSATPEVYSQTAVWALGAARCALSAFSARRCAMNADSRSLLGISVRQVSGCLKSWMASAVLQRHPQHEHVSRPGLCTSCRLRQSGQQKMEEAVARVPSAGARARSRTLGVSFSGAVGCCSQPSIVAKMWAGMRRFRTRRRKWDTQSWRSMWKPASVKWRSTYLGWKSKCSSANSQGW